MPCPRLRPAVRAWRQQTAAATLSQGDLGGWPPAWPSFPNSSHPPELVANGISVTPVVDHWVEREISSMGSPGGIDPMTHLTITGHSTTELRAVPKILK